MREKCNLTTIEQSEENVNEWSGVGLGRWVEKKLYSLRVCACRCGQHVEQKRNKRSEGAKKNDDNDNEGHYIYMNA